ncbi:MAG: DUF3179 domain-containing protein [Kineosporiaceae bacterium]
MIRRRVVVIGGVAVAGLVAVAVAATALLSGGGVGGLTAGADPTDGADPSAGASAADLDADGPSALRNVNDPALPEPLIDTTEIVSGGPPPDGIPPIDDPQFLPVDEIDFLDDRESVVVLTVDDETRAYPVQILTWHEIVNDVVADRPVTVTYCPLCNSALAFDRRAAGRELTFGTSGRLYLSNLVMYDRQTESLWPQAQGRAVAGVLTGTELERLPVALVPWDRFRETFPDALVLTQDTGHTRDYGRNPYVGYDDEAGTPFLFSGEVDPRAAAMTRVVGFGDPDSPVAVRTDDLLSRGVVPVQVADRPVVAFAVPGQASALDASEVADGADVGTTGVFSALLDGDELSFSATEDGFVDDLTGSTWDVQGRAVSGPAAGRTLERLPSTDTFWFSWQSFWPDTALES